MHVLFLAPDTHIYNHGFLRGLKSLGARVSAIEMSSKDRMPSAARQLVDSYRQCSNPLATDALKAAAAELDSPDFDRIETIDEPLVAQAAALREHFSVPELRLATARLCRDKIAMKEFLRQRGIPCARSAAVGNTGDAHKFAEREGYPLILEPIAGFGTLAAPKPGTPTAGLDKGWLVNTWFRLKHDNYDRGRELMSYLGDNVRAEAH